MVAVDASLRQAVARRITADAELLGGESSLAAIRRAIARALAAEGVVAAPDRWSQMVRDLVDELAGLGPLEVLLRDPRVTDVMVNGYDDVRVERNGRIETTPVTFDDDDHVQRVVSRVLARAGARLDRGHPWADAILDDGARIHAIMPPLASTTVVTIRRVPAFVPSWQDLAASGSVPPDAAQVLGDLVTERANIVVCGSAGSGKTTLLARLLAEVIDDRVVIIEDTPELRAPAAHAVSLRTRAASVEGAGEVTIADLVRNALRMRPDRIVVGEVRGDEVADLLQAMMTGHAGSMSTVHARGASDALVRLEGMALRSGIPLQAARAQVTAAVEAVITLARDTTGARRVLSIDQVVRQADGWQVIPAWRQTDEAAAGSGQA